MCMQRPEPLQTAKKAFFVWKKVQIRPDGTLCSALPSALRWVQEVFDCQENGGPTHYTKPVGTILNYKISRRSRSPFEITPGLYCFRRLCSAKNYQPRLLRRFVVIKMRVPKGTKYRRSNGGKGYKIVVEQATPVKVYTRKK